MNKITIFTTIFLSIFGCKGKPEDTPPAIPAPVAQTIRKIINLSDLQKKPISLVYQDSIKEPVFVGLHLIGKTTKYGVVGDQGKILRVQRFTNISSQVENRYGLPSNLLLAMVAQETGGETSLPNAKNDGGFGLCHMQPLLAVKFGLKTYQNCASLRSKKHGLALKKKMQKAGTMKEEAGLDDRLHPILDLDAVGRMMAYYMHGPKIKGYEKLDSLQTALCRYAGTHNYKKYSANVVRFMTELNDPNYTTSVESSFNQINKDFLINGAHADFKKYIEVCQEQNYNYGLAKYAKLGSFNYDYKDTTVYVIAK